MHNEIISYAVSILSGLCVCIPLVHKLVETVKQVIREKNWTKMLQYTMTFMQEAEVKFKDGASKKEWVMMMIKTSADTIDYDIDMDQVGKLIDSLCAMSKVVNAPVVEKIEG